MYYITKDFEFAYGHRVFTQKPSPHLAFSSECPCKRIHGHQGKITVEIEARKLDGRGFVIDFKELAFIKKFVDEHLDHRFILSVDDPRFEYFTGFPVEELDRHTYEVSMHEFSEKRAGWRIDTNDEILDSFFIVDFNPTSEELSKWMFELIEDVLIGYEHDADVSQVIWSETPKTKAFFMP